MGTRAARLLAALVVTAIAPAQDRIVEHLVTQLGSNNARERIQAANVLRRLRPPGAVAAIAAAIPAMALQAQSAAMSVLAVFPIERTESAYGELVASKSPFVRVASAVQLHRAGDMSRAEVIAKAVGEATSRDGPLIFGQLHGIRDEAVRDAARALVKKAPSSVLEPAIFYLLTTMKGVDQKTRDVVAARLGTADDAMDRAFCTAFLVAAGFTDYERQLADCLDQLPAVLPRIERYLAQPGKLGKPVVDALIAVLSSSSNAASIRTAARLLEPGGASRAIAPLRKLLGSQVASLRDAARDALAEIRDALKPQELHAMLADTSEPAAALWAADTLRRMDDLSGLQTAMAILRGESKERGDAAEVLGKFCVRAAVGPLIDALDDADLAVRRSAMTALDRLLRVLLPHRRIDLGTTGYAPDAAPEQRKAAVAVIREWWHSVESSRGGR